MAERFRGQYTTWFSGSAHRRLQESRHGPRRLAKTAQNIRHYDVGRPEWAGMPINLIRPEIWEVWRDNACQDVREKNITVGDLMRMSTVAGVLVGRDLVHTTIWTNVVLLGGQAMDWGLTTDTIVHEYMHILLQQDDIQPAETLTGTQYDNSDAASMAITGWIRNNCVGGGGDEP